MVEQAGQGKHEIILTNRNFLEVCGVISVESFDSEEFLLQTDYGFLGIRGQELHIKNLDLELGNVSIEGHFTEFHYLDASLPRADKQRNIWSRLFR